MQSAEDKNRETEHSLTAQQRQPASIARVLVVLASVVVVCAGMYAAAGAILNPIFFALWLALILSPVYGWLRRRLPTLLALLITMVGLAALVFGLVILLSTSLNRFTAELSFYATQWDEQLAQAQAWLDGLGLASVDLFSVVHPTAIATVLSTIAGAILSFLSNLFLILVLVLFFLVEGPAMMHRLQASVYRGHPRVERMFAVGKGVTHQFALRAVVNLATGAGVTLLLLVVGVPYPVLWGVLTFFLTYVPYIGLGIAMIPPALLALAESGPGWAIGVIIGVMVINVLAENALSPYLMGRGLNLSPTVVFFSFIFWIFLLGAPGAFLAMPLTLFLVALLSTYPEASWLASLMVAQEPTTTEEVPTADTGDSIS
ncbi:MAG: AI-2E family transporter [Rubrobacter sp.]|nr:AI-2E family transporter [Rubrobacter sp.]